FAPAVANKNVWGPVVSGANGGNVIIIGTDPVDHAANPGTTKLINEGVAWSVAQGAGKTGLYVCLSDAYTAAAPGTAVPILDAISPGAFTVRGVSSCTDNGHVVAKTPAGQPLSTFTDADFSNWSCSVHESFDSFDPSYLVLVIDQNSGASY